ncbi:monovalent cation/H(+) antiporter subunit G [Polycladidibacter hongkongensis]|uniref:monovalent cation/H(+) antiporter subunit G n=1 Tax=Polycladidibacter hongkongensis TaxID=1647556 RepID=UPI00083062F1|nr:monovalent cation/H(+) antiporter subunit G [Pseudovibrio hongkongensis]
MTIALDLLVATLLLIGAVFSFTAALGLLRLPDVYSRMHAASKAGTLGSGVLLLALGLYAQDWGVLTRALAGVSFFLLTAPISAHLIARAALKVGYKPHKSTHINDMPE